MTNTQTKKRDAWHIGRAVVAAVMTEAEEFEFVRGLYENFPEASSGSALRCINWQYGAHDTERPELNKPFRFTFEDDEGKTHGVDLAKAVKGFRVMVGLVVTGEFPGLSLSLQFLKDQGDWDGDAIDALAQCAVFGAVIYG